MGKRAVLLLAHGTPETVAQIPEYLRNVLSGRPAPEPLVKEIQHRYSLIGRSPLTEITLEQARLIERELVASGERIQVYVGMRNWRPYIPDVVKKMRADGVEEIVAICLAPQNSRTSVGLYRRAVEAEAAGLRIDFVEGWADRPLLAEAFAERLRPAWRRLSGEVDEPVPVLFTAHSVPVRTVEASAAGHALGPDAGPKLWPGQGVDSYAEDARRTAGLVAERVPEIPRWLFAFQSQGASGGPWLGPAVEELLDKLATEGMKALVLQPIGFLCDHVEILYDVDIHFCEYARERGMRLERPESLNNSAILAQAVAEIAREGLERLQS